jgi:hypothetical protein
MIERESSLGLSCLPVAVRSLEYISRVPAIGDMRKLGHGLIAALSSLTCKYLSQYNILMHPLIGLAALYPRRPCQDVDSR